MKFTGVLASFGFIALVLAFQNCGGPQFDSVKSSTAQSSVGSESEGGSVVAPVMPVVVEPAPSSLKKWMHVSDPAVSCLSADDYNRLGLNYRPVVGANCTIPDKAAINGGILFDARSCAPAGGSNNCSGGNTGKYYCTALETFVCS